MALSYVVTGRKARYPESSGRKAEDARNGKWAHSMLATKSCHAVGLAVALYGKQKPHKVKNSANYGLAG